MATVYLKSIRDAGANVFDTAVSSGQLAYNTAQSCESVSLKWVSVPKMVLAYLILMTILGLVVFFMMPWSAPLNIVHIVYSLLTAALIAVVCTYSQSAALVVMVVSVLLAGVGMFAGFTASIASALVAKKYINM